jgi:hypothetical protein
MLAKGISKQALQRTLLIGGTLIYQSCSDYARHRDSYTVHLETLLRSVPSLFFRDPFSAARARIIRKGVDPHDCLTVDNSLLLGNENPPVERTDREGCAVFFGRTDPVRRIAYRFGRVPTKLLGRFAFDVCDELDLPATWIPWGYGTSLNDLQRQTAHQFPGLAGWPDRDAGLQSLLDRLAKFKLVITDTYHLAVNAWRLGVPAICLADAVPRVPWLSGSSGMPFRWRDKRQTFYQQYDAQDFYVYLDELRDWRWRRRRIAQLVDLLRDGQAESEVCGLIRAHRDLACKQIETAVRSVSSRVNAPSLGDVRVDPLVPQVTTI